MREEKLPIFLYVEKGSFTFNCVESAEKLHGWGSPEKYILNKEHESLLREARAQVWEEASNATHQYPHYVEFRRFCRSKATEARKE